MKHAYFVLACDTDPDLPLTCASAPEDAGQDWRGISAGVATMRRALETTAFVRSHGQPPITWLLRCDRQIRELYGNPAFCYDQFAPVWEGEIQGGSEIGWHPHLIHWSAAGAAWVANLDGDDDLELLEGCLAALRKRVPVTSVRTGWDFHSNRLMNLFDRLDVQVDASAIPESVQSGAWHHDWRGAPRRPYAPARDDYRRPASARSAALRIMELPVIVRRLSLPFHALRFGLRNLRTLGNQGVRLSGWRSAGWQGVVLDGSEPAYADAARLALSGEDPAFFVTYFHTDALINADQLERFRRNLDTTARLAEELGWKLEPVTLSAAATAARPIVERGLAP